MNNIKNKISRIERARIIKRTLGTYTAARFLYNLGYSLEASLYILTEA